MLPSFVYHEKIPLMPQPHQTADPVHEWHLSEPRVNPMIRGNSPKGLCSWEKSLLQRGMQKIPGSTGLPLLAVWRYSGANKGTKMGSQMQWTFEENVFQRPPWNIPFHPPPPPQKTITLIKMNDRTSTQTTIWSDCPTLEILNRNSVFLRPPLSCWVSWLTSKSELKALSIRKHTRSFTPLNFIDRIHGDRAAHKSIRQGNRTADNTAGCESSVFTKLRPEQNRKIGRAVTVIKTRRQPASKKLCQADQIRWRRNGKAQRPRTLVAPLESVHTAKFYRRTPNELKDGKTCTLHWRCLSTAWIYQALQKEGEANDTFFFFFFFFSMLSWRK